MISVCKRFRFEAAHVLPDYDGPCANLHGHSYIMDVEVSGNMGDYPDLPIGMIIDFKELKRIVKEKIINYMDHQYLNDLNEGLARPTAEIMVVFIADILRAAFKIEKDLTVERIRLYETADSYAEWRRDK